MYNREIAPIELDNAVARIEPRTTSYQHVAPEQRIIYVATSLFEKISEKLPNNSFPSELSEFRAGFLSAVTEMSRSLSYTSKDEEMISFDDFWNIARLKTVIHMDEYPTSELFSVGYIEALGHVHTYFNILESNIQKDNLAFLLNELHEAALSTSPHSG